jgi:hypothetical protein
MADLKPAEIGSFGEKHATAQLQQWGYTCNLNTQLPGSTDIEAVKRSTFPYSQDEKRLVQVKTAIFPTTPVYLSSEEQKAIIARAALNTNCTTWLAQVQIKGDGTLFGAISWSKLS